MPSLRKTAFNYIVNHRLIDGHIQQAIRNIENPAGSQLYKAAWRSIGTEHGASFLARQACVCDQNSAGQIETMGFAVLLNIKLGSGQHP